MTQNNSVQAAFGFLAKRNPFDDIPQYRYATMLMDLQDNKGDAAIENLAGFYIYAIDRKEGDEASKAIETTFAHDLGGAKDKWCEPRSSGYGQFWKEEFQRYYERC